MISEELEQQIDDTINTPTYECRRCGKQFARDDLMEMDFRGSKDFICETCIGDL